MAPKMDAAVSLVERTLQAKIPLMQAHYPLLLLAAVD